MAKQGQSKTGGAGQAKAARLAAALRENLKRRKAQAKTRAQAATEPVAAKRESAPEPNEG